MRARWADPEQRSHLLAKRGDAAFAEGNRRKWEDPEFRERMKVALRHADSDRRISKQGYVVLRYQYGHPLASHHGELLEHRKVLYEKIGPGEHPCYWCGKLRSWGGSQGIHADHLDDDRLNNDPENLVPSCKRCNGRRGKGGGNGLRISTQGVG